VQLHGASVLVGTAAVSGAPAADGIAAPAEHITHRCFI